MTNDTDDEEETHDLSPVDDLLRDAQNHYPTPAEGDEYVTIGEYELAPDDYLNYKRTNKLGKTVYSGCYVIDVDPDEGTVEFFNLREEARVTHTTAELAPALGETLFHTGSAWTDKTDD